MKNYPHQIAADQRLLAAERRPWAMKAIINAIISFAMSVLFATCVYALPNPVESSEIRICAPASPKGSPDGSKITYLRFDNEPILNVFRSLADLYGITIVMPKSLADRKVTLVLRNVGFREVIEQSLKETSAGVNVHGAVVTVTLKPRGDQ